MLAGQLIPPRRAQHLVTTWHGIDFIANVSHGENLVGRMPNSARTIGSIRKLGSCGAGLSAVGSKCQPAGRFSSLVPFLSHFLQRHRHPNKLGPENGGTGFNSTLDSTSGSDSDPKATGALVTHCFNWHRRGRTWQGSEHYLPQSYSLLRSTPAPNALG